MEKYEVLAKKTRDLEQAYASHIHHKYSERIHRLESELASLGGESPSKLTDRISELERDLRELELARQRLEEKNAELATENENSKTELTGLRRVKDSTEPADRGDGSLRELKQENARLRAELASLKGGVSVRGEGPDIGAIACVQREILSLLTDLGNRLATSAEQPRLASPAAALRELANTNNSLRERVRELETASQAHHSEQTQPAATTDQRDMLVLLKHSLAEREKQIAEQKCEIDRLSRQCEDPFGTHGGAGVGGGQGAQPAAAVSGKAPVPGPAKKQRRQNKKEPPQQKKQPNERLVNIANLIKEDTRSFFNDLSFNNSSPAIDKTIRRGGK